MDGPNEVVADAARRQAARLNRVINDPTESLMARYAASTQLAKLEMNTGLTLREVA